VRALRPADLVVVGKARPNGAVRDTIARLGLGGAVRFVSGIDEQELVELYSQAELAVVPSLYEGFSFPAVEAMACGVPLVATTAGALPEVIGHDGGSGLLVPPGDALALAAAIGRALDDPELRLRMGAEGRARVIDRYGWARAAEATVAEYRTVLEGRC